MTVFSKLSYDETAKTRKQLREKEAIWPPPISFDDLVSKRPKKGSKDEEKSTDDSIDDKKNTKIREFDVSLDLSDSDADTYTKKFEVFENGKQVDWCIWRKKADDLAQLMGLNQESDVTVQARKRHKLFLSIMEGKCLETHQKAYEDNVALNTACDSQDRWNDLEVL